MAKGAERPRKHQIVCYVTVERFVAGMFGLLNCNLFLAAHISVKMITVTVYHSLFAFFSYLFADRVSACCCDLLFVYLVSNKTFGRIARLF